MHVSHRGRFGVTRLSADEQGVEALGHVIENRTVLAALDARLGASAVHRLTGARVDGVDASADEVRVRYARTGGDDRSGRAAPATGPGRSATAGRPGAAAGDAVLRARLVVGVDGVASDVRAALGIDVRRVDYRQSAVLGALALERGHEGVAHERFTDGGPLALLPRPARHVSFVECVTPAQGEALARLDEVAYLAHLQSRFGYRLGRFREVGPRNVVPLVRVEATRQIAPRAVLLGNAVRLLHPIAGQGYNLALRDAAELVERLGDGARYDVRASDGPLGDPGEAARLTGFAAARRADQRRVVALTDALARTFRGESRALSHLRALGLLGLDTVSPLRRRFARAAMGGAGG